MSATAGFTPVLMTKGEETRRSILDAAIVLFGRDGFRSTSVARIAREAGVGGSVPYTYFDDKEDLFLAALDEDAAAVVREGLLSAFEDPTITQWRETLLVTLVAAVGEHPLAQRVLAGLEPEVTARVIELPALAELRLVCTQRLQAEQEVGAIRPDVDPAVMASGLISITISLLMTVVQLGPELTTDHAGDVMAVFRAALDPVA